MEWFSVWWNELGLIGQIMACAAIPMTVVMILQLILMLIGVGFGSEADGELDDVSVDPNTDTTPQEAASSENVSVFRIFTIRGIVAFFALGGWTGLAALSAGVHPFWAIQFSLFVGVCALLLAAIVIRLALKMQTSGNLNLKNAVSQTGDVYIRIPPARSDKGKITMLLQERFVELDAITDHDAEIEPESKVEVIAITDDDCVVVKPVKIDTSEDDETEG